MNYYNKNELLQKVIDYPHCPQFYDVAYTLWENVKYDICELVIKKHSAGFWSNFNKVINNLTYYNKIKKITYDVKATTPDFYGDGDIFGNVFEEYISNEYNNYDSKEIIIDAYIDFKSTGYLSNGLHLQDDQSWRINYNILWNKYIKLKPSIEIEWENMKNNVYNKAGNKKIISFLIRHPVLAGEQINYNMPEFSDYDEVINMLLNKYNNNCIFIFCTDLIEAFNYFNTKYEEYIIINPSSTKSHNYENESSRNSHISVINSEENVKNAVLNVLMLSLGDHFIFPNSNMATAVLYINTNIIPHFLVG